jgi:hypothetical protein
MVAPVVYPRGFLGFDIGLPAENRSTSLSKLIEAVRSNRSVIKQNSVVISNHMVENAWLQYKTGDRFIQSFAFREQILKIAMQAFGTKSFLDWCILQTENPYMTEMHKRFLNDTFNFIDTGKRSVNLLSWMNLISVRELKAHDETPEYQYIKYFGMSEPLHFRRNTDLISNIITWVSRPGGYEDLVGTLHIFFGDKEIA